MSCDSRQVTLLQSSGSCSSALEGKGGVELIGARMVGAGEGGQLSARLHCEGKQVSLG